MRSMWITLGLALVGVACGPEDDTGASNVDTGIADDTGTDDTDDTDSEGARYGLSGCWITHTSSGNTQLDLVEHADGTVTGALSYSGSSFPVEGGVVDADGLVFSIDWTTYSQVCDYDFVEVSPTLLEGRATCSSQYGSSDQAITADRTCG